VPQPACDTVPNSVTNLFISTLGRRQGVEKWRRSSRRSSRAREIRERGTSAREEIHCLKDGLGLVERQIVVGLPKLSAKQIEALLDELRRKDPDIARTILNVSPDAAEPIAAAERYL